MSEETDKIANLILEHLRAIRSDMRETLDRLDNLTSRVSRLEESAATTARALADINLRLDRVDERLRRIERRLELVDENIP